jgi:hypothetical protein
MRNVMGAQLNGSQSILLARDEAFSAGRGIGHRFARGASFCCEVDHRKVAVHHLSSAFRQNRLHRLLQ